jgi:hypothetical protein
MWSGEGQPNRFRRNAVSSVRRISSRKVARTVTRQFGQPAGALMTYSCTQISQYLNCPLRYRHRYIDGWNEKDVRAAMIFGRAFELALGAFFAEKIRERFCFGSGLVIRIAG